MKPNSFKPADARSSHDNFYSYLLRQKKLLLIAAVVSVVVPVVLKALFPVPDFFLDSYSYVRDAVFNTPVTYRPSGYRCFLQLMHDGSKSADVVIVAQFAIFMLSSLFLFFSCDYLFGLPQKMKTLSFLLVIVNPILLLQTNLISSDSLFSSFTVLWVTISLWCIVRPNWYALVLQVVFLCVCFHLRYTAIYFPFIAAIFFLISKGNYIYKAAGICLTACVILYYVDKQKDSMEENTEVRILSAFSGWQIANNVLCYYKHIDINTGDLPTNDTKDVDRFVKRYIDSVRAEHYINTNYIWDKTSPLKYYMVAKANMETRESYRNSYFYQWCANSVIFNEYGWWVIKNDPWAYVWYFMVPNFKNYLFPVREVLGNYDELHAPTIPPETKEWFGFDTSSLQHNHKLLQEKIIYPYPAISFVINVVNVVMVIILSVGFYKSRKTWDNVAKDGLRMFVAWCIFYFSFMFFCVFSTIVLLRYVDLLFTLGLFMPFVLAGQLRHVNATAAVEVQVEDHKEPVALQLKKKGARS